MQRTTGLAVDSYYSTPSTFSVASTLISGGRDAVLIDAQLSLEEGQNVADWITASGKNLESIFITHAHPDHHFGVGAVLKSFPGTPVYATPDVVEHVKAANPKKVKEWKPLLGSDLTSKPMVPTPYHERRIDIDGQKIEIVRVRGSDAQHAAAFWVPSSRTLVAGDVAFDDCHLWLADADSRQRKDWLKSLESLQGLGASRVIPGHRGKNASESPDCLRATGKYIREFEAALEEASGFNEVIEAMTAKHPAYGLPAILELAAQMWARSPSSKQP